LKHSCRNTASLVIETLSKIYDRGYIELLVMLVLKDFLSSSAAFEHCEREAINELGMCQRNN
jgi:hypothetical protein